NQPARLSTELRQRWLAHSSVGHHIANGARHCDGSRRSMDCRAGWAQSCGRVGHFASGRRIKQQTNNKTTSKADPLRQRPKRWSSPYPCLSIEPLPGVNSRTSRQRCASDFSENKISRWLRLDKNKISRLAGFCFAESKISRSVRILHKWRRSSDTGAVRLG